MNNGAMNTTDEIEDEKEDVLSTPKFDLQELELDGVTYRTVDNEDESNEGDLLFLRRLLCFNESDDDNNNKDDDSDENMSTADRTKEKCLIEGPIVGCASRSATNMEEFLNSLDLDPVGYAGHYVGELLGAAPIKYPSPYKSTDHNHRMNIPTEHLRQQLETNGLAVWEGALPEKMVHEWRQTILLQQDYHRTLFHENGQAPTIRSDVVRFVSCHRETTTSNTDDDQNHCDYDDDDHDDPAAVVALQGFDLLEYVVATVTKGKLVRTSGNNSNNNTNRSNNDSMTLLRPDQGMMAQYLKERAAHYTWHYDNEKLIENGRWRNYRTMTAILYLNPMDWDATRDGGGLKCQVPSLMTPSSSSRIISPKGGTLVMFDSRTILHRVLPAHRDRLALTQWFVSPELATDDDAHAPAGPRRVTGRKRKQPPAGSTEDPSNKQNESFCRIFSQDEEKANVDAGARMKSSTKSTFQFGFLKDR